MSWQIYVALSTMMFLEFAIRGTWMPVLAARLLGPLGMTGRQVGWIYGALPLACIGMPLVVGPIVDRWLPTQWILAAAHLASGLALLCAAWARRFSTLLVLMAIHAVCFAPTLALVNSLAFSHMVRPEREFFAVRVWGSIAYVAAGCALAAWRRFGRNVLQGSDSLLLAALLSLGLAAFCAFGLPHTPPAPGRAPWTEGLALLRDPKILTFLAISFVATAQLQYYFMGTARYLEEIGFRPAAIPALMTVAQVAEIAAVIQLLPLLLPRLGYQATLTTGIAMWAVLFAVYAVGRPPWLVVASMVLHGLAFAFFLESANVYVNKVAPPQLRGSAQSLYTAVTMGLGLFVGTQMTGRVLDRLQSEHGYRWRAIFAIPCAVLIGCMAAFLLFFRD
jgi:nucleoside transporter